jgi:hypothetical protein
VVRLIFQAWPVWIYTQSNITSIIVDIVSLKALNRRYEAANLVRGSRNTILDLTRKINNLSRVTCICSNPSPFQEFVFETLFQHEVFRITPTLNAGSSWSCHVSHAGNTAKMFRTFHYKTADFPKYLNFRYVIAFYGLYFNVKFNTKRFIKC